MSTSRHLSSVLRQCRSALARQQPLQSQQQHAKHISTTAATQAVGLRQNVQRGNSGNNASRSLADLDGSPVTDDLRQMLRQSPQTRGDGTEFGYSRGRRANPADIMEDLQRQMTTTQYSQMNLRPWKVGDVYAPRDMGVGEAKKWKGRRPTDVDIFDKLGINPLDNYRNFSLVSEFMTPYGRIKSSTVTGLRPVNQRKIAKTIRRAIGLGIHPSVHYHPEILKNRYKNEDLAQAVTPKHKREIKKKEEE